MLPTIDHDPARYGDDCAEFYDHLYPTLDRNMLAGLQRLAGDGPALELGLATGRVAIPLARSGVAMYGIEASAAMRARFAQRADAERVQVIAGDFARDCPGQHYRLIFALVSTLSLLPSRDLQQSCLQNIASHLHDDGVFVYESHDAGAAATRDEPKRQVHMLQFGTHPQRYTVTTLPLPIPLLDAMAAASGLHLAQRWRDWRGSPHTDDAARHISVYRRSARIDSTDAVHGCCAH